MEREDGESRYQAGIKLLQAKKAIPRNKRLLKYLSEPLSSRLITKCENDFIIDQKSKMAEKAMDYVEEELYFVASLVGILTAMIRADGDVRKEEVATIRRFFSERLGYRGESLEIVRDLIKQFLHQQVDLDSLCADVARRAEYATRLLLVECLLDVALADGHLHPQEQMVFDRCVGLLGISAADAVNIRTRGTAGPGTGTRRCSDCEVLGVPADVDEGTVKKAYRELVKKYHPDRVSHLGEEFRELAHKKFLEIQNAYDRLCKSRGWS